MRKGDQRRLHLGVRDNRTSKLLKYLELGTLSIERLDLNSVAFVS